MEVYNIEMTKENFLDKWIEALPLNSKDADRKEMAYDIDLMLQNQKLSEQLKDFLDFVDIRYKNAGTRDKIVEDFLN